MKPVTTGGERVSLVSVGANPTSVTPAQSDMSDERCRETADLAPSAVPVEAVFFAARRPLCSITEGALEEMRRPSADSRVGATRTGASR